MKHLTLITQIMMAALLIVTTDYSIAQERTERIVIAPVGEANQPGVIATRQQLDDQVRRFADRCVNRMSIAADRMRESPLTPAQFESVQNWETMSNIVAVEIAIGPNAVTNLLDMMVLTALGRMVAEQYWIPERFGKEYGQPLLAALRTLEEDIWGISGAVLTPELQEDMRTIIGNYRAQHPDQVSPWWIRLDQFSGQRAARLDAIKHSGGLLREVRRTRETAEELRDLFERALFYFQRAPGITFNTMETSVLQLLGGPQALQVLENTNRFVDSVEQFTALLEVLLGERAAIVDQMMEGLNQQREALFSDLATVSPETRMLVSDLRAVAESIERVTIMLNAGEEPSEPIDIAEYRALAADVTQATNQLTKLVNAVSGVTDDPDDIVAIVDHLTAGQERVLNRLLGVLLISIAFFFVCLFAYQSAIAKSRGRSKFVRS